jgi:antitoxin component YwqK of YwqJK toxin-antitoxin module
LSDKGDYKNGKEEGSWEALPWGDNGQLMGSKVTTKNGKQEGSWVGFLMRMVALDGKYTGTYQRRRED